MITWHEVFDFFTKELGIPESDVRCRVRKPYSTAPTEYDIQIYGETAISYNTGFFWIPHFTVMQETNEEPRIVVACLLKCQGPWKDEFMKILSDFNKYIRQ